MDHLRFFRSVCNWGYVLFAILRVLYVIGAVGILIGIFTLSVLPKNFVTVDVVMETEMNFNMKALMGDAWEEFGETDAELPEGGEWTEDGFAVNETVPATTMENRTLALMLVPVFVEMILSFALFLFLCRVFRTLKQSFEPFHAPVPGNLRNAGWLLMALGVVPGICGWLISLLTRTEGIVEVSFDLWLVFVGFLLWAAADLFVYAASRIPQPRTESTPPPFTGYTGFTPPAAETKKEEPVTPPPAEEKNDDSPHHPDAF